MAWLAGWLAGCLPVWLACATGAPFFAVSSTKMGAPMVALDFFPRALNWRAGWLAVSHIPDKCNTSSAARSRGDREQQEMSKVIPSYPQVIEVTQK